MIRSNLGLVSLVALVFSPSAAAAQSQVDVGALADEAVEWLQDYVRINTINPPGNEMRGVEFLAGIFDAEGIDYETAESAPGRGNIWARLEGGNRPALVLLHHMDVVPADPRFWSMDPLSGEIHDGHIYGRGTLDTKTLGIEQLASFIALHRSRVRLDRDLIYMATADEEAGGFFGAGWLVENRPELFEGVGFLLNEGGGGEIVDGQAQFGIEVTQKVPYWLRLISRGEPSHGAAPLETYAVVELIEALDRLRRHEFEARIVPAVDAMFKGMAPSLSPEWQRAFGDMRTFVRSRENLLELQRFNPWLHALTRNTCSITRLAGSDKINTSPPEATAEIDCRLLPDQDPDAFLAELGTVLGPEIEIELIMGFTPAVSSMDTDLYRITRQVTDEYFPDAPFVPQVGGGFTDSHFFRDLGIVSYGYSPNAIPDSDVGGVHGNNERISVENVRRGVRMMLEIVQRFAAAGRLIMEE